MPVYCYECPDGHTFEDIRSIKEGETAPCPTCAKLSKRVPPPSVSGKVLGGTPKFYPGRRGK
jgi:putative FmdB family regulatory protein